MKIILASAATILIAYGLALWLQNVRGTDHEWIAVPIIIALACSGLIWWLIWSALHGRR